jgi:hypothetical protein
MANWRFPQENTICADLERGYSKSENAVEHSHFRCKV